MSIASAREYSLTHALVLQTPIQEPEPTVSAIEPSPEPEIAPVVQVRQLGFTSNTLELTSTSTYRKLTRR